jgi:predicted metalloendopeptidase
VQSIKPGKNFYKHVNGHWLQHASIPPFRTSFGVSEEVELVIEKQLQTILDKCYLLAEKGEKPSTRREMMMDAIGRFMLSSLRSRKHHKSLEFLHKILRPMICIRDQEDVMEKVGALNRAGISTCISVSVFQRRNPHEYTFIVGCGSLGLPDDTYYSGTAPGKTQTLLTYVKLCEDLGNRLHIDSLERAVQSEAALSGIMKRYKSETFEDIEGSKLDTAYPGISWDALFRGFGTSELGNSWKQKTVRIYDGAALKQFETLLKTWTMETWSHLFSLETILWALPVLPSPYNDLHFEFFGKRLRGQAEKLPVKLLTLNLVRTLLRIPLSYLYIEDCIDKNTKKEAESFAESIHKHALERLDHVEWMEPATRRLAVEKLKRMTFSISNPSQLPSIKLPNLITDNLLENMFLLSETNTDRLLERLNERLLASTITDVWDEPPYIVNAYYFNERNQFLLPAGSIQWPFYTHKRLGWKYGGLGAVIGHEITHAFDMDGREYNAKGEKENWWTSRDNAQYKKRTDALIQLFNSGKIRGHSADGELTLSENIADLGGLAIALDALYYELKGLSEEERKKELRDFFTAYAVSWRVKERPKKQIQGLFLDVHAPAEMRVNFIVSHFDEWYDIFDVVTSDDLYIPPEERVRIF